MAAELTQENYFGKVSHIAKPDPEVVTNATELLTQVNSLLEELSTWAVMEDVDEVQNPRVNSGWRPEAYNAKVPGAAVKSKHITGQAIDLYDPESVIDDFLKDHVELLVKHRLWMEHPMATKGWCHLQSVPPRSGNLIFIP